MGKDTQVAIYHAFRTLHRHEKLMKNAKELKEIQQETHIVMTMKSAIMQMKLPFNLEEITELLMYLHSFNILKESYIDMISELFSVDAKDICDTYGIIYNLD